MSKCSYCNRDVQKKDESYIDLGFGKKKLVCPYCVSKWTKAMKMPLSIERG